MLADFQEIISAVRMASSVDAALAILVRQVNASLPIDAFAVYLTDAESGEFALAASDVLPEPTGQIVAGADAGLLGLVGERQELVVQNNARAHPRYAPAAETGGQHFDTFLGVPLIHYHEVLGALVAWKRLNGQFDEDEVSFFLTTAAQLAKIIFEAANVDTVVELLHGGTDRNAFIQGVQAATGVAIGTATLLDPLVNLDSVPNRQAVDIPAEEATLRAAVVAVQAELGASSERVAEVLPQDVREVFDAYIMMLGSDSLVADTLVGIHAGNWAPGAWRETISEHAQVFDRMEDPYLRARGEDIRELGTRVLMQMQQGLEDSRPYPERCILVGDVVSIQDVAAVPVGRLAGIVSRQGSAFSHTAVLAKALEIPAVVSLSSLPFGLVEGSSMVVDGDAARIYVSPSPDVIDAIAVKIDEKQAHATQVRAGSEVQAQTLDGVQLPLHANIGLVSDIELAKRSEAEGVGLYRTEYLFLLSDAFPVEEEQYQRYRQLLKEFEGKPVTIRTLDVGGDKILSYFPLEEDNPFLGVRGIRFSLAHPEIFMNQLRALLRANEGLENLQVLFPMVAKISELDEALELLARAHRELMEEGLAVAKPKVGVMVEVPSAAFLTKAIATRVDFLSIGTNDLAQYVLAADRTNARVTTPDDTLHPAVLNAINMVICGAQAQNTPVSVCGEMAGDPAGALVLLGMGVDILSMAPAKFAQVKLVVRRFTLKRARELAREGLEQESENQVRRLLVNALEVDESEVLG